MKLLRRLFFSRLALALIGCILVGLVIWFVGPLLGVANTVPLSGIVPRAFAMVILPAVFGIRAVMIARVTASENAKLANEVAGPAAGQAEVDELSTRFKEALGLLKKSRFAGSTGRRYLYQLPWYMFIGPPGSGKTTALTNSGLNFPLADRLGKGAVKGVGGTRSCDWWFTDDAVLIDSAGRYTTQDSEAEQDKAAWLGFLKLLKRFRKRQPLNGVIVAIGISDLTGATQDGRDAHARAIKQRIRELYAELGVRLPIYVLFTKADLIAGFVEFFDDLGREERDVVWGVTFEYKPKEGEGGSVAAYADEYDGLVGRLDDRLTERLQAELDIERRALVFGFPQQVASLKEVTDNFLKDIFQPNRFEEPIQLRGVYFTSGTQFGTPIDRLMGAMSATFGINRQQPASFSGAGRSYFLGKLLKDVIFGEAGIVNADPKVERRNRFVRIGAYAGTAIVVLGVLALWTLSYFNNLDLLAEIDAKTNEYNDGAKKLQLDRVADPDLRTVMPLLNLLRDLPGGYAEQDKDLPLLLQFGLYQGGKVGTQAIATYERDLGNVFLPRLLLRLENQLAANQGNADFLYENLKVYLMLGRQGPLDKSLVKHWMALDWSVQFAGDSDAQFRQDLAGHLNALLLKPLPQIAINADIVQKSRLVLNQRPLAERAYSLLKTNKKVTDLPDWRISENAGPAAGRVFLRPSGRSLAEGIPGLYTYDGFYKVFLPLLPDIAKEVAKESWVLGEKSTATEDPVVIARLQRDVASLYAAEFDTQWDRLLGDVSIAPFTSINQSVQTLGILSAPDSPIKEFLAGASKETTLSKRPPADADPLAAAAAAAEGAAAKAATKSVPAGAAGAAGGAAGGEKDRLAAMLGAGGQVAGGPADLVGQNTDQHFKALHDLFGGTAGAAPIDGVVGNLGDLYRAMNKVGAANNQGAAQLGAAGSGDGGGAAQLQANAARMPEPLKGWVGTLTKSSSSLTVGGARTQLNALWTASVLPFCKQATENRYPIYPTGTAEVTLDDFSRLFSKGGLIDQFFATNLASFVDQSTNPWHWQKVDNLDLGISPGVLIEFQRAASIRDSMFPSGTKPGVSFELQPTSLDATSTSVLLEVDGQPLSYDHGPPRPVKMTWPGATGPAGVRVSFQPQGNDTTINTDGVWAWFRALDKAQIKPAGGPDRFNVTFNAGGRSAGFEIRANSVVNPFASNQLQQFRCPPAL
jgi:type VI secretion system protein ImpL